MSANHSQAHYAPLDEALARLAFGSADLENGMTSHAPMAAEALCALGRPDAVLPWVERYRGAIRARQPAGARIDPARWREALAREDRFSDWSAFFADELARDPWREVLDRWVARLAPGICAAATHGVIRVGHAARALGLAVTRPRTAELADALASWASTYQELPRAPQTRERRFGPCEAFARVPVVPPTQRRFTGTIVSSLEGLSAFPAFAPVIHLLDPSGDPAETAVELAEIFARVLLENARDALSTVVFVHGITSLHALANLLPHVDRATGRTALPYAWQSACALYATFAGHETRDGGLVPAIGDPWKQVDRAVAHGDEHAIKVTEACLCLAARKPTPVFAAAAERVLEILPPA